LITLSLHSSLGIHNHSILNVQVHHILGFKQETADEFAILGFHFHNGALGVVQSHNRNTNPIVSNYRHLSYISLKAQLHTTAYMQSLSTSQLLQQALRLPSAVACVQIT
jgi:hypothetical protein